MILFELIGISAMMYYEIILGLIVILLTVRTIWRRKQHNVLETPSQLYNHIKRVL